MDEHDDYSFEWLRLKDYDYWRLYLKEDQHPYLGRCVALNRREEAETYFDMNDEEAYDLRNIVIPEWRDAVDSLWPFDKENIASYGNDFRHLHWHLIPRRRPDNVPEMDGVEFRDENWGSHYKNHLEGEKPPRETVIQIRDDLKHALD